MNGYPHQVGAQFVLCNLVIEELSRFCMGIGLQEKVLGWSHLTSMDWTYMWEQYSLTSPISPKQISIKILPFYKGICVPPSRGILPQKGYLSWSPGPSGVTHISWILIERSNLYLKFKVYICHILGWWTVVNTEQAQTHTLLHQEYMLRRIFL